MKEKDREQGGALIYKDSRGTVNHSLGLVLVKASSQPLMGLLSQLPNPPLQSPRVHVLPPEHKEAAFGKKHLLPQAPQLLVVVISVSQPLLAGLTLASQLPKPATQEPKTHVPPAQEAEAWGKAHL